jgi:peptidoglycan/xylan/chitin deacetylase (PgdA/CDA1 family)
MLTRRELLEATAGLALTRGEPGDSPLRGKALVAITLDLEMSRNFPTWDQTEWDYEKGNLDAPTRRYALETCRRVRASGGVVHCFCVGRALEQADVTWLEAIVREGHPLGNHTYDHVNVKATRPEEIQVRFRRCPWLIEGRGPAAVIRDNVRMTGAALQARLGIPAAGFRTPGGFPNGLADRADVRQLLRDQGFGWVSSQYPPHPLGEPGEEPTAAVLAAIAAAGRQAQPFAYPDGLVEVPMSPVSDITAFRGGRWQLEWFLRAIRQAVEWTIEQRAVFDFLAHPSCLGVVDPQWKTVDLICDLVRQAGDRAALVDLAALAARAGSGPVL